MLRFLKNALFNGLVILLPLLFLVIIIDEFVGLMIGLATPIADLLFTEEFIDKFPSVEVLAFLIIAGTSMVVGALAAIPHVRSFCRSLEARTLDKIPVYVPLKALLHALLGSDQADKFKPAFLRSDNGDLEPAYIVEDTGRPRLIVLVPWTPNSFAGSLKLIPRERVVPLDLTFDEFSLSVSHFGVGMTKLFPETPEELKLDRSQD